MDTSHKNMLSSERSQAQKIYGCAIYLKLKNRQNEPIVLEVTMVVILEKKAGSLMAALVIFWM